MSLCRSFLHPKPIVVALFACLQRRAVCSVVPSGLLDLEALCLLGHLSALSLDSAEADPKFGVGRCVVGLAQELQLL
jgi:hypothetical protein